MIHHLDMMTHDSWIINCAIWIILELNNKFYQRLHHAPCVSLEFHKCMDESAHLAIQIKIHYSDLTIHESWIIMQYESFGIR